ncbi:hypothetical protein AALD74_10220 [Lachnospiraceae bacterium 48-21]
MKFKKVTAIAITAAMTLGSAMTAFAATSGDASGGPVQGEGSYEGEEAKYPAVEVTLPTVPAGTIDYIADPNDVISTMVDASGDSVNASYKDFVFNSDTGIYFKTAEASGDVKGKYSDTSNAIEIKNQNAQTIELTVKVSQIKAASGDVTYAEKSAFQSGQRQLYLAVTDGTTTRAMDASGVATFSTTISGKADNYKPTHDSNGYGYAVKDDADGWASASYQMTGAVNKDAEWKEGIEFPNVQMTWSWVDKGVDKGPISAQGSAGNGVVWMSLNDTDGFPGQPTSVTLNGTELGASGYTYYAENGWISLNSIPASGSVVLLTINGTVYKVVI